MKKRSHFAVAAKDGARRTVERLDPLHVLIAFAGMPDARATGGACICGHDKGAHIASLQCRALHPRNPRSWATSVGSWAAAELLGAPASTAPAAHAGAFAHCAARATSAPAHTLASGVAAGQRSALRSLKRRIAQETRRHLEGGGTTELFVRGQQLIQPRIANHHRSPSLCQLGWRGYRRRRGYCQLRPLQRLTPQHGKRVPANSGHRRQGSKTSHQLPPPD